MTQLPDPPDDLTRLYQLVMRISRSVRREERMPMGITAASALSALLRHGPMRLGSLAETEGVSAAAMSRVVSHLEELGFVARDPDPSDGRAWFLRGTDTGLDELLELRKRLLRTLHDDYAQLTESERTAVAAAIPALEKLAGMSPTARRSDR